MLARCTCFQSKLTVLLMARLRSLVVRYDYEKEGVVEVAAEGVILVGSQ